MKQYIVTKPILNIRNSPSVANDDNFIGQAMQGETLYLTGAQITGDVPKDGTSNIWFPDNMNRVVASEGVQPKSFSDRVTEFLKEDDLEALHKNLQDWKKWAVNWGFADLEIWKIWSQYNTKGAGVKVAVIDFGASTNGNDLTGRISSDSVSVVEGDYTDQNGHGTMSAGLIGANGQTAKTVYGIAPECDLIVIKAGINSIDQDDAMTAINKAINLGAVIVSMSFGSVTDIDGLQTMLSTYKDKPVLFLAATGDSGNSTLRYPAAYDGCISIGSYGLDTQGNRKLDTRNNTNAKLKFLCPGIDILSCSLGTKGIDFQASSAATAFAAGVMALLYAVLQKKPTFNSLIAALQTNCYSEFINATGNFSPSEGYGVLSPLELLNYLNTQS